ncbi:MAG: glycosyltransferase family 4 protein [Nostocaceae cyanobacterium]|nr:glycosyltransferase family 4 protein [Nostocaceae cyanobacterium]
MNVVVVLEHRFHSTPDGKVWTQTAFPYSFWQRYLEVFESVRVVARVRKVPSVPGDFRRADGENVSFAPVPYYVGSWQYLLKSRQVKHAVRNAVDTKDAVILRVSSQLGACLMPKLQKMGHPYAVEVVADPYDVFAPGSIKHPLRPLFRWLFTRELRHQCAIACSAAYVTKKALQQRYPCPQYSVGISDVHLPDEALVATPRPQLQEPRSLNLIYVGTMAQLYKAPDILIKAVAVCVREGLNLKLTMVGDGQYRQELKVLAATEGLEKRSSFLGQLSSGDAVRNHLDLADLFVLPSYQEGLPRAMVEAMARGLPCIGSNVGGIPELLAPEDIVPPGDVTALASKIQEVVTDPRRMAAMSARNLEKAQEYRDEMLHQLRIDFYHDVRKKTENWLNN